MQMCSETRCTGAGERQVRRFPGCESAPRALAEGINKNGRKPGLPSGPVPTVGIGAAVGAGARGGDRWRRGGSERWAGSALSVTLEVTL